MQSMFGGVSAGRKSDEEIANEGLDRMEKWMKKIGLVMNISDLGANEKMINAIAKSTLVMKGGYKVLTQKEIKEILKASL